ncbi:MAG: phage holin [Lachnospiraceae bacterium]|nr:phage holin [Lachnospiraceae bacterium]
MRKDIKVSKGTVVRTSVLVLAIANNALALAGKSPLPIDDDTVSNVVSFLFTTASALAAWWKNNSFTAYAIEADRFKDELKEDTRVEREGE